MRLNETLVNSSQLLVNTNILGSLAPLRSGYLKPLACYKIYKETLVYKWIPLIFAVLGSRYNVATITLNVQLSCALIFQK